MSKESFLTALKNSLQGLPEQDINSALDYYSEMIDDRIEDGLSEKDAILSLGSIDRIVEQIFTEISLPKLVKQRISPKRRLKTWEIVLLAVGSPVWVPIAIALAAVFFSVYVVLWAVIISLYACCVALASSGLGGFIGSVMMLLTNRSIGGVFLIGASLVCIGLAVLFFLGTNKIAKGIILLSKKFLHFTKKCFIKKEESK